MKALISYESWKRRAFLANVITIMSTIESQQNKRRTRILKQMVFAKQQHFYEGVKKSMADPSFLSMFVSLFKNRPFASACGANSTLTL